MRHVGVAVLAIASVLSGCGGSSSVPSSPSPGPSSAAATDFTGLWTGSYKVTSCGGQRHCDLAVGTLRDFGLRLGQTGSRVRGLFTQMGFAAEISGDLRVDGSVVLSGEARRASQKDSGMTVSRIVLRMSGDRTLQGSVAYEIQPGVLFEEFAGAPSGEGEIATVRRDDLRAFVETVDGKWSGRFAIRGCTPPGGARFCNPHEDQEAPAFELTLARSGDSLSGTFVDGPRRVPVTGRIAGNSISLAGESDTAESGAGTRLRITGLNGSIDSLGRLNGTFVYEYLSPASAATFGETATAELWQVVRVP